MCVVSHDCNDVPNAGGGKKQLKQSKNNRYESLSNRSRRADTRTLTGTDTVHASFRDAPPAAATALPPKTRARGFSSYEPPTSTRPDPPPSHRRVAGRRNRPGLYNPNDSRRNPSVSYSIPKLQPRYIPVRTRDTRYPAHAYSVHVA